MFNELSSDMLLFLQMFNAISSSENDGEDAVHAGMRQKMGLLTIFGNTIHLLPVK